MPVFVLDNCNFLALLYCRSSLLSLGKFIDLHVLLWLYLLHMMGSFYHGEWNWITLWVYEWMPVHMVQQTFHGFAAESASVSVSVKLQLGVIYWDSLSYFCCSGVWVCVNQQHVNCTDRWLILTQTWCGQYIPHTVNARYILSTTSIYTSPFFNEIWFMEQPSKLFHT